MRFPGLPLFPLGVERYAINGGCAFALEVFPNDEITLLDEEGMQACAIAAFSLQKPDKASDIGLLGAENLAKARGKSKTLGELLAGDGAESLRAKLSARGCDLRQKSMRIFDEQGRPGAQHRFSVQEASLLIVCAERQNNMFESMAANGTTRWCARWEDARWEEARWEEVCEPAL